MLSIGNILLICLVAWIYQEERLMNQCFFSTIDALIISVIVGFILGNPVTGLFIGGTMVLMGLGVNGLGGASVPNYVVGGITGTAYAIASGGSYETGLLVGTAAATLAVSLDVLSKMFGSFFLHKAQAQVKKRNYKGVYRWLWLGTAFGRPFLVVVVPSFIFLIFGNVVINNILAFIPAWVMTGMNCAGHLLPALGVAILLRYLPIKKDINFIYIIIGFVCAAYLKLPTLATALIGIVLAAIIYSNAVNAQKQVAFAQGGLEDE